MTPLHPATEPIKIAADEVEPGDWLGPNLTLSGRWHEVTGTGRDIDGCHVCLSFTLLCMKWFRADDELTILPGPARCLHCRNVYDDTAERPSVPVAEGRVHATCLVASDAGGTARLFDAVAPGRKSWARPEVPS